MRWDGETNGLDLSTDIDFWCDTNDTSFPQAKKILNANFALDDVVAQIMRADGRWKWDDTNNSDLPVGTTSLVASQQDYSIATTHLKILKVRAKDGAGNWYTLDPVDRANLTDADLDTTVTGVPVKYTKQGNSFYLYPIPNYSSSGGLSVEFQRGASYFAVGDTTKEPGFASMFHRLISLKVSEKYCMKNNLARLPAIQNEILKLEALLGDFYARRNDDEPKRFTMEEIKCFR